MTSLFRLPTFLIAAFLPSIAAAQTNPQAGNATGADPITSALQWMQSILLGPIATSLAVMAIAGVGFMMLTGRMNWRYGGTVIMGVFIFRVSEVGVLVDPGRLTGWPGRTAAPRAVAKAPPCASGRMPPKMTRLAACPGRAV